MLSLLFIVVFLALLVWTVLKIWAHLQMEEQSKGRSRISGNDAEPVPDLNPTPFKIGLVAALVLALLSTAITNIGAGEVGIVTRFGAVTGRELNPGVQLKLPWPVEKVVRFDTRIQKDEANASAASVDLQDVTAKLALNYHLNRGQISEIYRTIGTDYNAKILDPALQETFKAVTAQYSAADLIAKRQEVKAASTQQLADRLRPMGIVVDGINIVNFNFSAEFNKAIEQKQIAQQNAERAVFDVQRAQREAEAQNAQKQSLTPELLTKQAIERWDGKMPNSVGGNSIFGIPLTK